MGDIGGACCQVELLWVVSEVVLMSTVMGLAHTKRAFWRQVETSSGRCSETVGLVSAECCQLRGGCAWAMVK